MGSIPIHLRQHIVQWLSKYESRIMDNSQFCILSSAFTQTPAPYAQALTPAYWLFAGNTISYIYSTCQYALYTE
jgi:hypothetical protein